MLQPVQDGLVEKLKDYPGYSCFNDAIKGFKRTFKVMDWTAYYEAKRKHGDKAKKIDFLEEYTLEYKRLPGYDHPSQKEYTELMLKKLEERRSRIVEQRRAAKKGFAGRAALKKTLPGSLPQDTKKSTRTSHRPRILRVCSDRKIEAKDWYFDVYFEYKEASIAYRDGDHSVVFPDGTYKPLLRPG